VSVKLHQLREPSRDDAQENLRNASFQRSGRSEPLTVQRTNFVLPTWGVRAVTLAGMISRFYRTPAAASKFEPYLFFTFSLFVQSEFPQLFFVQLHSLDS
jgi:hypothetical protein